MYVFNSATESQATAQAKSSSAHHMRPAHVPDVCKLPYLISYNCVSTLQVRSIMWDLLQGLAHLHQWHIYHRDLKVGVCVSLVGLPQAASLPACLSLCLYKLYVMCRKRSTTLHLLTQPHQLGRIRARCVSICVCMCVCAPRRLPTLSSLQMARSKSPTWA